MVLTMFNEAAYLTFKSVFHFLVKFVKSRSKWVESVPGNNQY